MTAKRPLIRTGTRQDVLAFLGQEFPHTARIWVGEVDGEIHAIWGWYLYGMSTVAFMDMDQMGARYPVTIMKAAKDFMRRLPKPAVCFADADRDTARAFLERLGWEHSGPTEHGEMYACQE